jgi:hypothetical protein
MSAYDPFFNEEDLNEPDYRCIHGTFVGNPYGGDYLCHYCEGGYTAEEVEAERKATRAARARARLKEEFIVTNFSVVMRTWRHILGPGYFVALKSQLFAEADAINALSDDEALALAEG